MWNDGTRPRFPTNSNVFPGYTTRIMPQPEDRQDDQVQLVYPLRVYMNTITLETSARECGVDVPEGGASVVAE